MFKTNRNSHQTIQTQQLIALGILTLFFCFVLHPVFAETQIYCGQIVSGSIDTIGEKDIYTFTGSVNDKITIRGMCMVSIIPPQRRPSCFCPYFELYAPDGKIISQGGKQIDNILPVSGKYTLIVRDAYGVGRGRYRIFYEILNKPCSATPFNYGQYIDGSITYDDFIDVYALTASSNDKVTIWLVKSDISLFLNLELYAPDGTFIEQGQEQIDKTLPVSGRYTLIVQHTSTQSAGKYRIFCERLNSPYSATALGCGQHASGSITYNECFKFYTITAFANDSVSITVTATTGSDLNFYPYLELYTPDGTKLAEAQGRIDKALPVSGKYTIIVRDNDTVGAGNYDLFWTKKNNPPTVGAIIPSSGASLSNRPVNFTASYSDSDPAGWQDIKTAYFLIGASTAGTSCFWGYYDGFNRRLFLRNDNNTAWLGGFAPGENIVIENSYAKLDCSKTTVSGTGTTLAINWSVEFKSIMGNKAYNTYLYAKDELSAGSGWIKKGTWKVDNMDITSFLPSDKSRFIENTVIGSSVQVSPSSSLYQYQFLVDGKIKRPFNVSNAWNWQTTSNDIGVHNLTVQVKNQNGNQIEKTQKIIVYRRPIEP